MQVWTDALKNRVKELWLTHTSREISVVLQAEGHACSRNAVIGLLHRAGLTVKDKADIHPSTRDDLRPKRTPRLHVVRANGNSNRLKLIQTITGEQAPLRCVEIEPRHLTLADLEPSDCRYPYGDGQVTYCGHPIAQGSYCGPHHALTHEAPRRERRAA